jgi:hypothetical protein
MRKSLLGLPLTLGLVFGYLVSPTHAAATPFSSIHERWSNARPEIEPCLPRAGTKESFPTLANFVTSVKNGDPNTITGVYVCPVLALQVVQQPANDPVYVSTDLETATQFRLASDYGTIGLLAHNDHAGARFFDLLPGHEVDLVYGDGTIRRYIVNRVRHFQAVTPDDPYSTFNDLDNGGAPISSTAVFQQIFAIGHQVVFQTCIDANGNPSWGRLFVIATPIMMN